MSVLIEEIALVAVREDLESVFPGGVYGFLNAASALSDPPHYSCVDSELLSIGFRDMVHAQPTIELLPQLAERWVLVSAERGPEAPMPWIKFSSRSGVARAWLAGKRPGKLVSPDGWSPGAQRKVEVVEGGMLRLAVEDGIETYLDLGTGLQVRAELPVPDFIPAEPSGTPLHDSLIAAMDAIGWDHHADEAPNALVDLLGTTGLYSSKYYANETASLVVCFTRAPLLVPLRARRRVMDFITRANFGMQHGSFELGLDDGLLGFRTSTDVVGSVIAESTVRSMVAHNISTFDRYMPYLMEVIYGKRQPRDAVEAAERE
jgi:hypothetical protein